MTLVRAGEPAPEFVLPSADADGTAGLRDHLDRGPVLLGLSRGISCAFCRQAKGPDHFVQHVRLRKL